MNVQQLGWDDDFERRFDEHRTAGLEPARVARRHTGRCIVWCASGTMDAVIAGRLHDSGDGRDLPAVGDWVALERTEGGSARIDAVVSRRTCFSRRDPGRATVEQVIAANVDIAFLVSGLDRDFSLRRIERYLLLTLESGARPVIILNKSDLCDDAERRRDETASIARGASVHLTCGRDGSGLEAVRSYLRPGRTIALLGSSGVGKSTLINELVGDDRQAIGAVRAGDGRGRHTTTTRELIPVPGGGLVIDTPGLREVQLWLDESTLAAGFDDVEQLATECRFRDCDHDGEPGCAVQAAVARGELDERRLASFRKLRAELRVLEERTDERGRRESRARDRRTGRMYKRVQREKRQRRQW